MAAVTTTSLYFCSVILPKKSGSKNYFCPLDRNWNYVLSCCRNCLFYVKFCLIKKSHAELLLFHKGKHLQTSRNNLSSETNPRTSWISMQALPGQFFCKQSVLESWNLSLGLSFYSCRYKKQVLSRQSRNPPASDGVTITLTCCFFIPTAEKRSYSAGAESCGKCSNLRFSNFAAALYHSLLHSGSVKLQKQNPPAMDSV